jgi:hypothetical protein
MDAMTTERPTIGHNAGGRMTEAEYERERAKIAATKQQAGVRWEQELARLFARSGWSTKELAAREGRGVRYIQTLLKFGQFLGFMELRGTTRNEHLASIACSRFDHYWRRLSNGKADRLGLHDRERFREIARLMTEESGERVGKYQRKPPISREAPKAIIKKLGDAQWHKPDTIAKVAGIQPEEVAGAMDSIRKYAVHGAKVEHRKVGKETHYRIFKQDKTVSTDELTEKLTPILEELEAEGKKNMATMVPAKVAMLTARIKQLLKEWAE